MPVNKATTRELRFALALHSGEARDYAEAARIAGYAPSTEPSRVAASCRAKGLLADADVVAKDVLATQLATVDKVMGRFALHADDVAKAMLDLATGDRESGRPPNLAACEHILARLIGTPKQAIDMHDVVDDMRRRIAAGELDPREVMSGIAEGLGCPSALVVS